MAVSQSVTVEPKSSHVADDSLRPFLQPSFDPADHLNATLPQLHLPIHAALSKPQNAVSLADHSSRTQTLLSQLDAQASRLTNLLTQLTDEILRSGTRLSYEVDVLRGETVTLSETLNEGLKNDVELFIPNGLSTKTKESAIEPAEATEDAPQTSTSTATEPEYITRLRTLTHVRSRLDTVIKTFNAAMQWPCPPSDSLASGLLSVSTESSETRDAKAREFAETLRSDVVSLITEHPDPREGHEEAMKPIGALRDLVGVFKGTAEERVRMRFVEGLEKWAGDKLREAEGRSYSTEVSRSATPLARGLETIGTPSKLAEKGVGWLDSLGRMRNG